MTLYDTLAKIERRIKNEAITKVVKISDGYVVFVCGYDGYTPLHEPYFFDRKLSLSGFNMKDKANKEKLQAGKIIYKDSTPYRKNHKSGIRMDADKEGSGNTALPYGLCNKYGIQLPEGTTPKQAWEALKDKTGITPDKAYAELNNSGTAQSITPEKSNEEKQSLIKSEQAATAKYLQEVHDNLITIQDSYKNDLNAWLDGSMSTKDIYTKRMQLNHKVIELEQYGKVPSDKYESYEKDKDAYYNILDCYKHIGQCATYCTDVSLSCQSIFEGKDSADTKLTKITNQIESLTQKKNNCPVTELWKKYDNTIDECLKLHDKVVKQVKTNEKALKFASDKVEITKYSMEDMAYSESFDEPTNSFANDFEDAKLGQYAVDTYSLDMTLYKKTENGKWTNQQTGEIITDKECYDNDLSLMTDKLKINAIDNAIEEIDSYIFEAETKNTYNDGWFKYDLDKDTANKIKEMYTDLKDNLSKAKNNVNKVNKVQPKINTVESKYEPANTVLTGKTLTETHGCKPSYDAYSQKRKDEATWCKSTEESVKAYGSQARRAYSRATDAQRNAAYRYTEGSGHLNRPLSGYQKGNKGDGWSKDDYVGIGNVDLNHEGGAEEINALTDFLGSNEFDTDIWVQHGFETQRGVCAFLGIPYFSEENLWKVKNEQSDCHFPGFLSCGAAKGTGFTHRDFTINIYAPKGTKGVYIAPGSAFGGRSSYNGSDEPIVDGHENEILLQRDTHAVVTKYSKKDDYWFIDVEITSQEPVEYKVKNEDGLRIDSKDLSCYNVDDAKDNSGGNTQLPFGLCKGHGIQIVEGWTPTDAWNALFEKTGITPEMAYADLKEKEEGKANSQSKTEQNKSSDTERHEKHEKKAEEPTYEEKYALTYYIGGSGYTFNSTIRDGYELSELEKIVMNNLDSVLQKMPYYEGDLNRSVDFDDEERLKDFLSQMKIGEVYSEKTYMSCSTADKIHNPNANVQISIKDSKNARDVRSYNKQEKEILYERDASFRVISVKTEKYFNENTGKTQDRYLIEMEELNERR